MIAYLFKVIFCSGLLYVFYFFFLQKEKMLVFNRFYLLGGMLLPFLIPLAVIEVRLKPVVLLPSTATVIPPVPEITPWPELLLQWAFVTAGVVSVVLLLRFALHLYQIRQKIKGNEQRVFEGATLVLSEAPVMPHSFFNYIFLKKADFDHHKVEAAILMHELAHVRQKHTWDIVLTELIGALMWFNPFVLLYRRAIRLNHEFLADQAAAGGQEHRVAYQQLLLKTIYVNQSIPLASSFYFLTTKKRLLMLQQETNRFRTGIKAVMVAPVLALLIFVFAERVYTQEPPPPPPKAPKEQKLPDAVKSLSVIAPKGKAAAVLTYRNGKTVKADISSAEKQAAFERKYGVKIPPPPPPPPSRKGQPAGGKGASAGEMKTYVDFYQAALKESEDQKNGNGEHLQQLVKIYLKMTESQRAAVPELPSPPPPPTVPELPPPAPPAEEEQAIAKIGYINDETIAKISPVERVTLKTTGTVNMDMAPLKTKIGQINEPVEVRKKNLGTVTPLPAKEAVWERGKSRPAKPAPAVKKVPGAAPVKIKTGTIKEVPASSRPVKEDPQQLKLD
ncbi:M56 family metallopeptidase [Niabella beijingensis]|uniref:M56 family metallopeptidase n=1 Tax=Niabella beijingensis TaxID=2872700 RepID=UPI001CBDC1B7|nr:M56 family metallopeptidase [Niabella beijingensis]MBZ4187268.1 M56 family metallopeptidase [Niabella beijingensis]